MHHQTMLPPAMPGSRTAASPVADENFEFRISCRLRISRRRRRRISCREFHVGNFEFHVETTATANFEFPVETKATENFEFHVDCV